jgi:mono/diheme cytochrome c family protein
MRPITRMQTLSILAMLVALSGCGKKEADQQAPQAGPSPTAQAEPGKPSAADMEDAKNIFQMRCVICHGQTGKGDGPGAASLEPKPRNYSDKAWQATVTDDDLKQVIVKGGAALGKSPIMPPNPDLEQKPKVLAALIVMIRGFAAP